YVEPFVGGGAIFFAKQPSPCEVINDTNCELINFYEVLKTDFDALSKLIELSLHSRKQHDEAEVVFKTLKCLTVLKESGRCGCPNYSHHTLYALVIFNKRDSFT
ncbi:MAG: DNA adenine methylase, partial [Treponemataceae bacterium]